MLANVRHGDFSSKRIVHSPLTVKNITNSAALSVRSQLGAAPAPHVTRAASTLITTGGMLIQAFRPKFDERVRHLL